MGLTKSSVGSSAIDTGLDINPDDKVIALAGNPNVGKSTLFNALTGLNQHTGNWAGKTVSNAKGYCKSKKNSYVFVDIPGTYSLMAHSPEEEVARDFICFNNPFAVVVVCDATCLERNLNLVLQTMEISSNVIVCVNLMDEAKRKGIKVNLPLLSKRLGVPVIGTTARRKRGLSSLLAALDNSSFDNYRYTTRYGKIEGAIKKLTPEIKHILGDKISNRAVAIKLLENDMEFIKQLEKEEDKVILNNPSLFTALTEALKELEVNGINNEKIKDITANSLIRSAEELCLDVIISRQKPYSGLDRRIDKIITGKYTAYPIMLILLGFIFWLTIMGANYPSAALSNLFAALGEKLTQLLGYFSTPPILESILIDGIYHVLTSVIAVMLPPMAIFFPLFTLLEDVGILPRIAYNLDRPFKKCGACGKQSLTLCMGFGCNAAGVVGARIIDSKREQLLAVLTNNFTPCNGRFPMLISVITMFFVFGAFSSFISVAILLGVIILSICMSFLATKLLSSTLLKGMPSAFTLELPPYRKPQIGKIIVRSVFDRTLFVLGRAAAVAAPAGLIIWIMANITVSGESLLFYSASFLDPLGKLMGLDGVILIGFILGFPANEIVIPIITMAYMSGGTLENLSTASISTLFVSNGWTITTAVCFIIFTLMHWPCSTTLLTVKKETGSLKWTAVSAILPTLFGVILCIFVNLVSKLL